MSYLLHLMIASLLLGLVPHTRSQTFHYSRGWTNGKRSEQNPLALSAANMNLGSNAGPGLLANPVAPQTNLEKLFNNPCELERFRNWLNSNNMRNGPCDFLYDEGRYKRATA